MRQTSDADLTFMNDEYERLLDCNAKLEKQLRESQECVIRITKRNNELRGKVLRLINNNEELKEQLERQVHNNIKMEYVLNKFKEALQEADNE